MSLMGNFGGGRTELPPRPVHESPNELIVVRPRERDAPVRDRGGWGTGGKTRTHWQEEAIMGSLGRQGLAPKITRRNSGQGKFELQAEYNVKVGQAALESESYEEFMVRYAQLSFDYGINTGYFVKEWGHSADVYPDHAGSVGENGVAWDELVPVAWYTPEELSAMSPEQLDSLVTGNRTLISQGAKPWEYQTVGVNMQNPNEAWLESDRKRRQDPNNTPLLSMDRADEGPIGDHYHRAPPSAQWETIKTQDPMDSTLGVGNVIQGWGRRQEKIMAPSVLGNVLLGAATLAIAGPLAGMAAGGITASTIGQGIISGALTGGATGTLGAIGQGKDPLKGGLIGAASGGVAGGVGGSYLNKAAVGQAVRSGAGQLFPDTPAAYAPALPDSPAPIAAAAGPASAMLGPPIELTPPVVPSQQGLLNPPPPPPPGGVTLTPPQLPAATTAPTVHAPTVPGGVTLTPPQVPRF